MPTLTCPVCADRYQVEFDQLADDPPCPRCAHAVASTKTELWKRPPDLDDMHVPFPVDVEPVQPRRGAGLVVAVGLVTVLILGAAVAIGFALHARSGTSPEGAAKAASAGQAYDGPWPECADCLRTLRENVADPDSMKVLKWESRVPDAEEGRFRIQVKLSVRNRQGGFEAETWQCGSKNGKCTGCTNLSDYYRRAMPTLRPPP